MKTKKEAGRRPPLKDLLEEVRSSAIALNQADRDPIRFARIFFNANRPIAEIEAAALFSAMLSYGSAKQFIKKINEVMQLCDWRFLSLITNPKSFNGIKFPLYRLSTANDIVCFAKAIGAVINKYGGLKCVFLSGYNKNKSALEGFASIRNALLAEAETFLTPVAKGVLALLPNPLSGGCAKRYNMFLRWLARPNDGVDMGLWPEVSPSELIIPLDLHISRIARNLSLTSRKTNDIKTAVEITDSLRKFCPQDPVRYDFSLCHLGISKSCDNGKTPKLCESCQIAPYCLKGQNK